MKNISENTIKLFKSNYKLAISELENKILEKEIELENFFNNDNISKSKNSYTVSLFYTSYDNFILGLENESNSNQ